MKHIQRICLALVVSSCPFALAAVANTSNSIIPDNVVLCQAESKCFSRTLFGRNYKVLITPRFTVMVSLSKEGIYTRADVSILNNTAYSVNLTPDDFRIEVLSPKPRVLSYVSPADLKDLPPQPTTPLPPAEKTGSTTTSPPRLLMASTAKPSDMNEMSSAVSNKESQQDTENAVTQQHLAVTSIAPNETVRGRVYFERDKRAENVNIVLPSQVSSSNFRTG